MSGMVQDCATTAALIWGHIWGHIADQESEMPPDMPLTDIKIRSAKPRDKAYKLFDGGGLYLEVTPTGRQVLALEISIGKEKRLALGVYPDVSLKAAREKREAARQQLAHRIDPGEARKTEKIARAGADTFEEVAREWHAKFSPGWVNKHSDRILQRLENDIFPWLGKRTVGEIKAPELLAVLRRIESRGALETAHRALQNCGQAFRYAIATGRAERDPTRDLRGALPPPKERHHASIIEPKRIAELLRAIDAYQGYL
jgi:Arm DNA-binding domain